MPATSAPCEVCLKVTEKQCGACQVTYLCECQKKLWPLHKWLCGKPLSPFTFPPLSAAETQWLRENQDRAYIRKHPIGVQTWVEAVMAFQPFRAAAWTTPTCTLLGDMQKNPGPHPEPERSCILHCLRLSISDPSSNAPFELVFRPWMFMNLAGHVLAYDFAGGFRTVVTSHAALLHTAARDWARQTQVVREWRSRTWLERSQALQTAEQRLERPAPLT
ncbi:hypothetical protein JCM10213_006679 [Rhodosporidiobolus nylandii]